MSTDRHNLAAEIFVQTMDLDAASREQMLANRCGDDPALRAEVESLLSSHDGAARRMETPAAEVFIRAVSGTAAAGAMLEGETDLDALPQAIGPYRVLGLLGEGGMGRVYVAEQDQPRRRVALKVIRAGAVSRSILRRFEREAAALARLQHPGIAHVYQTGTADTGRGPQPFLAMELVEGLPLTRHAREHALSTRQKLELVARVCDAVQHAHERGIVHRDLKPANVLVIDEPTATGSGSSLARSDGSHEWGVGRPKVLDFGVARLTDDDHAAMTAATSVGQLIGTLAYMSPEQVSGGSAAVDARSDVYALGVMLYELLAGRLPIDARSMSAPEAVRAIRQDDPPTLSSIDRSFRGDVETIVAKALEKNPDRRYQSAADLADDLRRHLADQPIVAHPPSAMYQFAKFAQRNRGLVVGLGVAAAVLVLASAGLAVLAAVALAQRDDAREAGRQAEVARRRADEAREKAETQARTTRRVNAVLNDMLSRANPSRAGSKDMTLVDAADGLAVRLDTVLADEAEVRSDIQDTLARLYTGLGRYTIAAELAMSAYEEKAARLGRDDRETLITLLVYALALHLGGNSTAAHQLLEPALSDVMRAHPDDRELRSEYLFVLSTVEAARDRFESSLDFARRTIEVIGDDPTLATRRRRAQVRLINILAELGRTGEAVPIAERVLPEIEASTDPQDADLVEAYLTVGRVYSAAREHARAEPYARRAVAIASGVLGEDHPRWFAAADALAGILTSQFKFDEALPLAQHVLDVRRRTLGESSRATQASINNLGWLLTRAGRYAEAEPLLREAVALVEPRAGLESPTTLRAYNNLANALNHMRRFDEALEIYERIVPAADRALPADSVEPARYRYGQARSLIGLGRHAQAEALLLRSHEVSRDRPTERLLRKQSAERLVEVYRALQREDEAARWQAEADGVTL
ncbi:MAG: serine/threonine protein kinase [Phycisphaeraceae bacterium]|nr:serine/threonine protein kinase [Phycisphaeraceae bacterium]MBX3406586.1 serine/threonine protein kinase [Phycisphaeraceae bacterium]